MYTSAWGESEREREIVERCLRRCWFWLINLLNLVDVRTCVRACDFLCEARWVRPNRWSQLPIANARTQLCIRAECRANSSNHPLHDEQKHLLIEYNDFTRFGISPKQMNGISIWRFIRNEMAIIFEEFSNAWILRRYLVRTCGSRTRFFEFETISDQTNATWLTWTTKWLKIDSHKNIFRSNRISRNTKRQSLALATHS